MKLSDLKKRLWGYSTEEVFQYIAQLNEEYSKQLNEAEHENKALIQELRNENLLLKKQHDKLLHDREQLRQQVKQLKQDLNQNDQSLQTLKQLLSQSLSLLDSLNPPKKQENQKQEKQKQESTHNRSANMSLFQRK